MRGDTRFGTTRLGKSRGVIFVLACLATLAGGCSESKPVKADDGTFDSSRLPRVTGAKEIFASAATTIFTSPDSVAQTADTLDKALAATGWQKYVAPNTAYSNDPSTRIMSLKKGSQALSVFITIAPAQNNATSVQYGALPLKTDLPFTKDASNIEYSPDRALLTLVTAEPVDKTLDFYRKELGTRGWSLWSEKTNGKQPADGPSGVALESGGYAHYITDKNPSVTLVLTLQKAETGKFKVELKQWPVGILADLHNAYVNSDNFNAALVDVIRLPRLAGAKEDAARSSKDRLVYSVAGSLANTIAAVTKTLGADGWKPYVAPLDDAHTTLLAFKKGPQGLSVSFTIQVGKNDQTSELTTVYYSPTRLNFALAIPADATGIVFDENRPYLNATTAGTIDATLDFYRKQLAAVGWSALSAADAAARWPNAKLDDKPASGAQAYYIRGTQRVILLSLQPREAGKVNIEIKVPPFALPQTLEAGQDIFGLPTPKLHKSAGGTGGTTEREMYAHVPAETGAVLAFYRRELTARNWKEQTAGAVLDKDAVALTFTSAEGTAVLKLAHKYDLTTVSLVQKVAKPAAKAEPAAKDDSIDSMMRQAQQMMRDATADVAAATKPPKMAQASNGPAEVLRPLAGGDAPVPVPENAEDVEFDGADGKLEFSSPSDVKMVAYFYQYTMKAQGWQSQASVINNANMVVLNFSKARKAVSFTIMKMGNKTNVTADGSALKVAAANSAAPAADTQAQPATADDLIAEESGGLPVPKRHTMSEGTTTPFRRELNANVPLDLSAVLGFYRRELGKLNWKEDSKGAAVTADSAAIAYASPEGPAVLKLGRKNGETIVRLAVKNPDAAAKAGVLPKPGRVKVMFGNINGAETALTFNNKTIKVAAGAGTTAPDGPTLDLAPGKYKYSIKLAGRPVQNDEVEVGADETWGLMIGPGGVLALQAY